MFLWLRSEDPELVETWLGLSATAWSGVAALATATAVLVALGGAVLVLRQISQARELAEDQARPYLVPILEESGADWKLIDFVVRNVGQTAARNLTMTFVPPYIRANEIEGYEFMTARFIGNTTPVLVPGGELRTFIDSAADIVRLKKRDKSNSLVARPFTLTLRYQDRLGHEIEERFDMDVSLKMGTVRMEVHGIHHLAKSVRAMAKKQGISNF